MWERGVISELPFTVSEAGTRRVWRFEEHTITWTTASRRALSPSLLHGLAVSDEAAVDLEGGLASLLEKLRRPRRRDALPRNTLALVPDLRRALVSAPTDRRERARALVEERDLARPVPSAFIAAIFTDRPEWTHAAARALLEQGARPEPLFQELVCFVTDPALALELAHATFRSAYGLAPLALDLLAHLGPAALPVFGFLLRERFSDASAKPIARALALMGGAQAAHLMVPLVTVPALSATVRAWARRERASSLPVIDALLELPTDEALDIAMREEIGDHLRALRASVEPPQARPAALRWPGGTPPSVRALESPSRARAFLVGEELRRLRTRAGETLPEEVSRRVVGLLSTSPESGHATLRDLRAWTTDESCGALGAQVFERWLQLGANPKEGWALRAIGHLGVDPEISIPHLEPWTRGGASQRAAKLLDAIAMNGDERALLHLDRVRREAHHPSLRVAAERAISKMAERCGLDVEALERELAPRLGFDESGERSLSLGARSVVLRLDSTLRVRIRVDGRERSGLPRRRRGDDRHDEAKAELSLLRRDVKRAEAQQRARLLLMMVAEGRAPTESFDPHFVRHPLVRRWAEGVLWGLWDRGAKGPAESLFALEDSGALVDVDDRPIELAADRVVGIVHPAHLDEASIARWSDRFADHGLIQPFAQLARPVHEIEEDELRVGRLTRLEGAVRPWRVIADLLRREFSSESPRGARRELYFARVFGSAITLRVSPGLAPGSPVGSGPQTIVEVNLGESEELRSRPKTLRSELVLALESLL